MKYFKPYRGYAITRALYRGYIAMCAEKDGKEVVRRPSRRELEIEIDRICSKTGSELATGAADHLTEGTPSPSTA
jgi:hypothetical protein